MANENASESKLFCYRKYSILKSKYKCWQNICNGQRKKRHAEDDERMPSPTADDQPVYALANGPFKCHYYSQ